VLRRWSFAGTGVPTGESLRLFGDAFRNGWSSVLSSPLPMRFTVDRSPVVVVSTAIAATVSFQFLVRSRARFASVLGPIGLLVTTRVFGAQGSGRWMLASAGVIFGSGIIAVLLQASGNSRPSTRKSVVGQHPERDALATKRLVASIAIAGVVALVASLIASALPMRSPADVRRVPPPQRDIAAGVNPLALLSGWTAKPQSEVFRFRLIDGASNRPLRWRLAVLDRFTGASWQPGDRFTDASEFLPDAPADVALDPSAEPIRAEVVPIRIGDAWLPVPGWPKRVESVGVRLDEQRGVLRQRRTESDVDGPLRVDGIDPGVLTPETATTGASVVSEPSAGVSAATFRITGQPLLLSIERAPGGLDTSSDSLERVAVPRLPPSLSEAAESIVGGASDPLDRARRLEAHLRSRTLHTLNPNAVPGHSYQRLETLLLRPKPSGGQGTSEQYATAFAVLARSLGMPTRVVVGFDVPADAPTSPEGFVVVNGAMAKAWPEVRFAGIGWIPFDPTPEPGGALPLESQLDETVGGDGSPTTTTPVADTTIPDGTVEGPEASRGSSIPRGFLFLLVAVFALLGLVGVLRGWALRRRASLRQGTTRQQVFGAWVDTAKSLRLLGVRIADGESTQEFVRRVATTDVDTPIEAVAAPLEELVVLVDASQFSRREPADSDISRAWSSAEAIRTVALRSSTRWQRWSFLIDPR
jgi:transglutaminase-like putative cysteine protease